MTNFTILTVASNGAISQETVQVHDGEVIGRAPVGSPSKIRIATPIAAAPMVIPVGFDSPSGDLAYCGAAGQM